MSQYMYSKSLLHMCISCTSLLASSSPTYHVSDSYSSPASCALQAQARCHRIGQTRPVTVYRLLSPKTYEMIMFERSSKRLGLVRPTFPKPKRP